MQAVTSRLSSLFLSVAILAAIAVSAAAEPPSEEALSAARAAVSKSTPRDAGARHGQALGAGETCTGLTVTDKAVALASIYEGAELEAFKAQSDKIYDAWIKVRHCVRSNGPSQCNLVMDESCAAAISEIGPAGSVMPGLLTPPTP